jgi:hypothetical protein
MPLLTFYTMPTKTKLLLIVPNILAPPTTPVFLATGLNNLSDSSHNFFTNLLSNHLHRALQKVQSHHRHARLQATTRNKLYQPVGRMFQPPGYASRVRSIRTAHDL